MWNLIPTFHIWFFWEEGFYGEREYSPLNMQIHYLGFLFFCAFVRKRSF